MLAALAQRIDRLVVRVAELERRLASQMRPGEVHSVDASKGTVRLKLGEGAGGQPFLSAPIPYAQHAGALKAHAPPSVGQQMMLFAVSGDLAQGLAVPMTWSNGNGSPSTAADRNVVTFGSVRIEIASDRIVASVGGTSIEIEAGKISTNADRVENKGRNIGHDHVHPGVLPGAADTEPPKP